jgi:glycosyltransferase involved in cell wall biosynthesis
MEWEYDLSVVMPVYNGEEFVADAIDSVLSQTLESIELVIINDGSTDSSEEIIQQYLPDPDITYVSQENKGVTETTNRGIRLSEGEYLTIHPQDDVSRPHRFETQMEIIRSEDVNFVFTPAIFVDFDGNELSTWGRWQGGGRIPSDEAFYKLYTEGVSIASPSVVFGRDHIHDDDETPWGDPDLDIVSDWQHWLVALQHSDAYEVSEPLIEMLRDEDHDNLGSRRSQVYDEERLVIKRIRDRFQDGPHPVKRRHYAIAMSNYHFREVNHRLNDQNYLQSMRLTLKSLCYNPFNVKVYRKYAGLLYPN